MAPELAQALADERDELTEAETREFLDEETRRLFGLSLDEFVKAAEADALEPHPALAHLVLLTGARSNSC